MTATLFAGDLLTGRIRVRNIPASSASVSTGIGLPGLINCSVRLPLIDPETGVGMPIVDLIVPGKSFIGYEENGVILNAGPVWVDQYFDDSGTMAFAASGLGSYFDHRLVIPVLAGANLPEGADTIYTGLSLRTIAKRLVQQARTHTGGALPIVFEADIAGGNERTYLGRDLHVVQEKLEQLSGVINGPDIAFRPRYKTDRNYIEWVMLTGNPEITQAGPDHIWDLTVPSPAIKGVKIVRNGHGLATNNYQVGSRGEDIAEDAPAMAKASEDDLLVSGYPILESVNRRSSVGDTVVLQGHADEAVFLGKFQEETWSFSAAKNQTPMVGEYLEGDYATVVFKNNPRVADGRYSVRIMSMSTSLDSGFMDIECAPERVRA